MMAVCGHYTEPRVPGQGKSSAAGDDKREMVQAAHPCHWQSPPCRLTCQLDVFRQGRSVSADTLLLQLITPPRRCGSPPALDLCA